MSISRKTKKILFSFFWIILIASFLFFAVVLVAYANGYHLNIKTLHLQQTAMIVVDGPQSSPSITLKNKTYQNSKLPVRFGRLFPGRYEIKVEKADYQRWGKVINLEGGQAITFPNVLLFFVKPQISQTSASSQVIDQVNQNYQNEHENINSENNELRYKNQLITRFSQQISGAIYDSQYNRFYVQLGNELRTLDFDGSNTLLLFKLPTTQATNFYLDGNSIYYVWSSRLYQVQVR